MTERFLTPPPDWHATLDDALARIETRGGRPKAFEEVLTRGSARIGLYAPRGSDPQQPHEQDEVYIGARGTGEFLCGTARRRFAPGDMLFVPARAVHRFERFTDDLALWVVFYGPAGGEVPSGG
jgi:mannose-6-phosphate isomerase-like protein (cupin superfamily)